MAGKISTRKIHRIQALQVNGESISEISRKTGCARKTVKKYMLPDEELKQRQGVAVEPDAPDVVEAVEVEEAVVSLSDEEAQRAFLDDGKPSRIGGVWPTGIDDAENESEGEGPMKLDPMRVFGWSMVALILMLIGYSNGWLTIG